MSRGLYLTEQATQELDEAVSWLDSKQEGLGGELHAEVSAALERILKRPEMHAIVRGDVRRGPIRRFHYSVFYRVKPEHVEVIAIVHDHRDPAVWQQRV